MKYKHFTALFFKHFIQPSPPTVEKLKSLHGILRDQLLDSPGKLDHQTHS